mgnify:CR=1 FL=1
MPQKRILYFDVLNILACICVIWLHCNSVLYSYDPGAGLWRLSLFVQVICHFAVPAFFMISGANLMNYREKYSTAEFIKRQTKAQNVWISTPTWPNHNAIFNAVGMTIREYRYYDAERKALDWEHLLEDLSQASEGDVVLLHGCCHNPTGIDPTPEQWQELAALSAKNGWLPLFDFAYQGLANGLDQDAYGLRAFAANHKELLVASSFSKNFGLYNERVGAFTLVAENAEIASTALTQVKSIIRTLYSNPASHGGATVATVLNDAQLRQDWENELTEMRERIKKMRHLFVQLLKEYGAEQDFSFIMEQNGMFSFSGLSPEQVDRLKEEFAIYAVRSGRINVAGITEDNIRYLCESIVKVL